MYQIILGKNSGHIVSMAKELKRHLVWPLIIVKNVSKDSHVWKRRLKEKIKTILKEHRNNENLLFWFPTETKYIDAQRTSKSRIFYAARRRLFLVQVAEYSCPFKNLSNSDC